MSNTETLSMTTVYVSTNGENDLYRVGVGTRDEKGASMPSPRSAWGQFDDAMRAAKRLAWSIGTDVTVSPSAAPAGWS